MRIEDTRIALRGHGSGLTGSARATQGTIADPAVTQAAPVVPGLEGREPDELAVRRAAEALDRQLQVFDRRLDIRVDREAGKVVVQVIDTETDEMIRQIPPDQVLRAARLAREGRLAEARGVLLDERL